VITASRLTSSVLKELEEIHILDEVLDGENIGFNDDNGFDSYHT
jgi:hypothetical protein